jgi:hypothetical protein
MSMSSARQTTYTSYQILVHLQMIDMAIDATTREQCLHQRVDLSIL